jgi:hypothetical protein
MHYPRGTLKQRQQFNKINTSINLWRNIDNVYNMPNNESIVRKHKNKEVATT